MVMNQGKIIIYQMLPRVFGNRNPEALPGGSLAENGSGKFSDITTSVLNELRRLSISHIWYTGVIKHSTGNDPGVKGGAGSPYAISDYYDVNSYLCDSPLSGISEFEELVDRTHEAGIGVIIDFVPNHVAVRYDGIKEPFTSLNYYPGHIHDGDWSDTAKLNYGNRDTWEKMKNILFFWASRGVDGFRCDMIELVPVEFWEWVIPLVKERYPHILFIGEAYQPHNYYPYIERGGFDYLYDKSGFYDTLKRIVRGEGSASDLTFRWQEIGSLQGKMLNFLENHDEDRITSEGFASGDPFRALSALFVSLFFNTAPFMIYFGEEFGEGPDKTSIFDFISLPTVRRWLRGIEEGSPLKYLSYEEKDLYALYCGFMRRAADSELFSRGTTYDLQYANPSSDSYDPHRIFSFIRQYGKETSLCVANFSDFDREVGVHIPKEAFEYLHLEESSGLNSRDLIYVPVTRNAGTIIKIAWG